MVIPVARSVVVVPSVKRCGLRGRGVVPGPAVLNLSQGIVAITRQISSTKTVRHLCGVLHTAVEHTVKLYAQVEVFITQGIGDTCQPTWILRTQQHVIGVIDDAIGLSCQYKSSVFIYDGLIVLVACVAVDVLDDDFSRAQVGLRLGRFFTNLHDVVSQTCIDWPYRVVHALVNARLPVGCALLPTVLIGGESKVGAPLKVACVDVFGVDGHLHTRTLGLAHIGHHARYLLIYVQGLIVQQVGNHLMIEFHTGKNAVVQESHIQTDVPFGGCFPFQVGIFKARPIHAHHLRVVLLVESGPRCIGGEGVCTDVRVTRLSPTQSPFQHADPLCTLHERLFAHGPAQGH